MLALPRPPDRCRVLMIVKKILQQHPRGGCRYLMPGCAISATSGSHRSSYGGFGGGHSHFHLHAGLGSGPAGVPGGSDEGSAHIVRRVLIRGTQLPRSGRGNPGGRNP